MNRRRLLCPHLPQLHQPALLSEQEARHARKVLRLRNGDLVEALDGQGHQVLARLSFQGEQTCLEWVPSEELQYSSPFSSLQSELQVLPLYLEMAILKGEAMEWSIEKAVELGVQSFIPLITDHTVVQTQSKGAEYFQQRWQKIADQALKQCGRLNRMEIHPPVPLKAALSGLPNRSSTQVPPSLHLHQTPSPHLNQIRLWCDEGGGQDAPFLGAWAIENQSRIHDAEIHILIGPEGGWSAAEKVFLRGLPQTSSSMEWVRVHLGPSILRAETAALSSVSILSAFLRAQV